MDWGRTDVVLTGAAGGIGSALVEALLARGARRIHAADLPRVLARYVPPDSAVKPLPLDITDHAAVAGAAEALPEVSLVINNAGVNLRAGFLQPGSLDAARRELEVNYFGTAAMCRAFAPVLARHGGGTIVNVLSILAKVTNPALGTYCASKAALLRLTEGVRAELAAQHTRVIAALPWAVDTEMSRLYPGTKTSPDEVAAGIVDAVESGAEEVYFHDKSREILSRLATDPKGLERELAAWLPR